MASTIDRNENELQLDLMNSKALIESPHQYRILNMNDGSLLKVDKHDTWRLTGSAEIRESARELQEMESIVQHILWTSAARSSSSLGDSGLERLASLESDAMRHPILPFEIEDFSLELFGIPLLEISTGYDPRNWAKIARGIQNYYRSEILQAYHASMVISNMDFKEHSNKIVEAQKEAFKAECVQLLASFFFQGVLN